MKNNYGDRVYDLLVKKGITVEKDSHWFVEDIVFKKRETTESMKQAMMG